MKVKIGKYKNWFGPYQLAEKLCFWAKPVEDEYGFKDQPKWVHNVGEWLAFGSVKPEPIPGDVYDFSDDRPKTVLFKFLLWLEGFKERKIEVKIDRWDTWNMAETLALIITPMLKQLKETKHGSPYVNPDDVPAELKPTTAPSSDNHWVDDTHHERWNWVMDEMIWAMEQLNTDWESQYWTGEFDMQWKPADEEGMSEMYYGPNHTAECDWEGRKKHDQRIDNGLRLFGTYFRGLWD